QRNLIKKVRSTHKENFAKELAEVFNPDNRDYTPSKAKVKLQEFADKWEKYYKELKDIDKKTYNLFTYLSYDYRVRRMIYTTNWIERLNKSFRRILKMRNALPNPESAIVLLAYKAMDMEEGKYSYPISNFKNDKNIYNHYV
ncbi:MAG: transposase, partial [Bacteroidetes bacterium]|nr:transposase [Bacteroidota bacterium]